MRNLLVVLACLAGLGLASISASAAETHASCVAYDNNGNITTVVGM